jgi:hypothetical protein
MRWSLGVNLRVAIGALILQAAASTVCMAQATEETAGDSAAASPYVPLADPAYALIDALQIRGALNSLSMLERPYTMRALDRAIRADSSLDSLKRSAEQHLARMLDRYRLPAASDSAAALRLLVDGEVYATAQSSGRRELMLGDSSSGVYPGILARFFVQGGPWVTAVRIDGDARLKHDPEFTGRVDKKIAGRMEDAYVAGQWRFGEVFFGRLGRNWGPPAMDGLLLGHYAYSYDHLSLTLGVPRLHLTTIAARLDDRQISVDTVAQRYFSIHRLSGRWKELEVAVSEAIIYGGRGRGFEPKWLNPVNGFYLSQLNESPNVNGSSGSDGNMSYGVEASLRTARFGVFSGQFQLDDIAVNSCDSFCKKPPSYGLTVSADGIGIPGGERIGDPRGYFWYTRVTNLTYRNATQFEQYMVNNIGLGRGFSDYDEYRIGLGEILGSRLPVKAYFAERRQGEGDYRIPQPPPSQFSVTPTFLSGVVEQVSRIGMSGSGILPNGFGFDADIGYNRNRNADHVAGRTRNGLESRFVLSFQLPWRLARKIASAD